MRCPGHGATLFIPFRYKTWCHEFTFQFFIRRIRRLRRLRRLPYKTEENRYETVDLSGTIETTEWHESARTMSSAYPANPHTRVGDFGEEVLTAADVRNRFDFSQDKYDQNGDGFVDLTIIFYPDALGTGFVGTFENNLGFVTNDRKTIHMGTPSQMTVNVSVNVVIFVRAWYSFPGMVGNAAHEYGHAMNLPELFDRDQIVMDPSAGIGRWGIMGWGAPGWVRADG